MSTVAEEKLHHPFSPSKLAALEFCPCYSSKSAEHIKAAIGTLQHRVAESRSDDMRLGDDEAAAAAQCLDFVERQRVLLEEARQRDGGKSEILELTEVYLPVDSRKFEWAGQVFDGTTGGWIDQVLISHDRKRAILVDYKFGYWRVEAASVNPQGIAYALGLFKAYPELEVVEVYFYQPSISSLSRAEFYRADVPALYLRICAIVERAAAAQSGPEPDWSKANPGHPTCCFCARLGSCPKVAEIALKVSKKFYPAGVPDDCTPTSVTTPGMAQARLQIAGILKIWCDAVRRQETDLTLRSGRIPDGFRVDSRTPREIVDKRAFKAVALKHLTEEELDAAAEWTFGPVEAKVKDAAPRGQKKDALENLDREWREAGAIKDGQSYSFLKAVNVDEKN